MLVAVVSGKGGVGKTTISLAMAKALAEEYRVGLFDVDITGANTHLQLELIRDFDISGGRVIPGLARIDGATVEYISIALVSDCYVKWRGDSVGDFVHQVINNTKWTCDFLILDTPPGSHQDAVKAIELCDVVVLVTIPTEFAESDLKKTIELIRDLGKPIAGVYVNFTSAVCPHCGREFKMFDYKPDIDLPVIQEIPFGRVEIDTVELVKRINNPVILPSEKKSTLVKRNLAKFVLKSLSKLR